MKTTLAALAVSAFLVLASFFAIFPRIAASPVILISQKISNWHIQKRSRDYATTGTALKDARDLVDIYITISEEVARSPYDADYAYRDALYNLASEFAQGFSPDTV